MDTYSGGTGMTPVPVPAPAPHGRASSRASSALAALSILAILLYLLWRFIWQYRKHETSRSNSIIGAGATAPPPVTSSARQPPPSCPPPDATAAAYAPPRTTTTTTTSFPLSSVLVVPLAAARLGADKVDCAVCLAELGDGGEAGLVPGCGHGFHAECIEAWFRVNSTCPLCRAAVGRGTAEVPRYDSSV